MPKKMWTDLVEVDRPFADIVRDLFTPWGFRSWMTAAAGRPYPPVTDVFARNGDMVVRVELPGIDPKKDVTVTLEDGELTIKGERKQDKEVEEEGYYRKESTYGYFERHITVPEEVKESDIRASYSDGVLELVIPKAAEPTTKPKAKVIPITKPEPVKA